MTDSIEISPYLPSWPDMFKEEASLIQKALGSNCVAIHHIGSTAVPHLAAKPIIDILPVVKDILEVDRLNKEMEALGYEAKGEYGVAFRRFFQKKKEGVRTHNVHIFEENHPEIARHLKFRDWMRTHDDDAEKYAKLKKDLATRNLNDITMYTQGKESFIAKIDEKAGHEGWCLVQALTMSEWNAVMQFREQYFTTTKTRNRPLEYQNHIHFVFYHNQTVIGYANIQLLHEKPLQMVVMDKNYQEFDLENLFTKLCERWIKHHEK